MSPDERELFSIFRYPTEKRTTTKKEDYENTQNLHSSLYFSAQTNPFILLRAGRSIPKQREAKRARNTRSTETMQNLYNVIDVQDIARHD